MLKITLHIIRSPRSTCVTPVRNVTFLTSTSCTCLMSIPVPPRHTFVATWTFTDGLSLSRGGRGILRCHNEEPAHLNKHLSNYPQKRQKHLKYTTNTVDISYIHLILTLTKLQRSAKQKIWNISIYNGRTENWEERRSVQADRSNETEWQVVLTHLSGSVANAGWGEGEGY